MKKDPTEFRKRFAAWKNGKKPYENGRISDELYIETMEKVARDNWQQWGDESEDASLTRILNDNSYDYRGYYNKYPKGVGNAQNHWTDEFKTVWHPSFSIESKYSGKKSQYNPYGYPGGTWQGEFFTPQWYQQNPNTPGFYKDGYPRIPKYKDGKVPGYYLGKEGDNVEELIKRRLEQQSDATTVQRQEPVQPIKRNFIAEAQRKHAAEAVGQDTRSSYQRKQSLAAKLYANQQYQKAKDDAKRAEGLELMMKTVSPSTYVEAATGLDLGTAGRLVTDAVAFGLPGIVKSLAGSTVLYGKNFLLSQMMNPLNKKMPNATHTVYYPTQGGVQKELYLTPRKTSTPALISWIDAQKPLSAEQVFSNAQGAGWLQQTADRLGVNVNHYYNNLITPEELRAIVKNSGYEAFVSEKTFAEPAYIPSGFPYGLDKAKILMPYEQIRKMPMMAKYANLPETEFRKVADDLIGSHEFVHWYNKQLAKNIKSGRMKTPKGYLDYELTWNGENLPDGIDPDALGEMLSYISAGNGTESNARLGQLFNAFNIKKGQFAPQHINLAKKFYRQVFPDNLMSLFLNAIKDKDALVKFANRNAGTLFGTGLGVAAVNQIN